MKLSKKKVFTLALAVCMIAILSMSSLAWFTDEDSVTNDFYVAGSEDQDPDKVFSVDVWEDDDAEDEDGEEKIQDGIEYPAILPGDDLYKEVNVENTGAYDQYVRVTVTVSDAHIWQEIFGEVYVSLDQIVSDLSADFTPWSVVYNADEDTLTYVLYYQNILTPDEVVTLFTNVHIPEAMDRYQAAEMAGGFVIDVVAEAVQTENVGDTAPEAFETVGMAVEAGERTILTTAEGLKNVLTSGALDTVVLPAELANTDIVIDYDVADVTIDANGTATSFAFTALAENVTIVNIRDTEEGTAASVSVSGAAAGSSVTIRDSYLVDRNGSPNGAVVVGKNCDLTVDNCEFVGVGKSYGIYGTSSGSLTITNSSFVNFGSWAIQVNGLANGDMLIDGCTFETPDGVLKVLSGVEGDFTFTNNTMIGCKGHDGNIAALVVSTSKNVPVTATGTITYAGNTLDGEAWAQ